MPNSTLAEPRWLNDSERRAWLAYLVTTRRLEEALDRQLQRDSGLPHTYYMILAMLSETDGWSLRMSDLAERTHSSQSRLSHAVARLEENGWVIRKKCPSDRRGNWATLTQSGFDTLAAAAPGHVAAVRRHLFDVLTPEQVEQLATISEAVLGRLGEVEEA
ncbi:MarR family transcriptional regulator [Longispora sp. NPDC051575]|uniref:MarR family winged helix-turn-helix transcriptional regulator n=1 Tax=Longispora sp. NPDC051575 TaxID=3154943 RepID=UPI00341CA417